jgi:receptor expression-enhancing protein 5/6
LLTPSQYHVSNLDKELSKYPALNNFERQTSVPKVYVVLGLLALYFFLVFFNIAGEFLVNLAGFIVPGYYSLEALFSTSKADDTQVSSLCHSPSIWLAPMTSTLTFR